MGCTSIMWELDSSMSIKEMDTQPGVCILSSEQSVPNICLEKRQGNFSFFSHCAYYRILKMYTV